MISMIAAVANDNVLADEHGIPWQGKMLSDVEYFRDKTLLKTIVMGGGVFKELAEPLTDRVNVVLTRDLSLNDINGFKFLHSKDEVLALDQPSDELMIIGGGQIYQLFMEDVDKIYLTEIKASYPGTVLFPKLDPNEWREVSREKHEKDASNLHDYEFVIYLRKK
jgi:dihydrofolate reductase